MTRSVWTPALVLVVGALLATVGVRAQRSLELRVPLSEAVPAVIEGYRSRDVPLGREEEGVAGVTTYLNRVFEATDTARTRGLFLLYVGYYDRQASGRTIHSPKNCLPGSGWEPLTSSVTRVEASGGPVTVNRYLIQKGQSRALVLYWYQGRGRVAANEYAVKWDLVRDAALKRRSDEALVRVVVPVRTTEAEALALASRVAAGLVASLSRALPA